MAPALGFALLALIVLTLFRLGLSLYNADRLSGVDGYWQLFLIGLRIDSILIAFLLLPACLLLLLAPRRLARLWQPLVAAYFSLATGTLVWLEAATFPFLAEYDQRPNRLFVEYLNYPREVAELLLADYKLVSLLGLVALLGSVYASWRWLRHLQSRSGDWKLWSRLLAMPVIFLLLVLVARSSLGPRPANPGIAAFSDNSLTNQLALNSAYALSYAVYRLKNERDANRLYPPMAAEEALARVLRSAGLPDPPPDASRPTLHRIRPSHPRERPPNLVIILEESLGARYVGHLGGKPLTPNLDRLTGEALWFSQLHATGVRSVRGIEAVLTGFLPTASTSVVKLGLAQSNFFTLAELFRRRGYDTSFIYGGQSVFDNMRGFFMGNGFTRVIEQSDFVDPVFTGIWGVSDEDLLNRAHEEFVKLGDRPFFSLVFSSSNHTPFEYPEGRIQAYDAQPNTVHNAIQYADYAIGEFMRQAREAGYFSNTYFLIVADHDTRVFGDDLIPIDHFRIPGLILGPGVPAGEFSRVASQIDLAPTLLSLMGVEAEHPMTGFDLLALPPEFPGRAIMQYYTTNAYRRGDEVVIHQANKPAAQFSYVEGRLQPAALDPELARDALAHIHLPTLLYASRGYALPPE